jgi:hypothetical protein
MPENGPIDEDEDEDEGKKPPRERPKEDPVKVVQTTKSLDPARAARVFGLWSRMLKGVHYPTDPSGGIEDADDYEFRWRQIRRYGEARTPLKGAVKRFVELGDAMIGICESSDDDLETSLDRLDAASDALEKQLDAQEAAAKPKGAAAVP